MQYDVLTCKANVYFRKTAARVLGLKVEVKNASRHLQKTTSEGLYA